METISSPSSSDDFSFEGSLLLSDSLKDLKNLRSQLYSAAEYFEVSYLNDGQKQLVANTLKEYTVNAFVNTVDHLGSVTYDVIDLVNGKVDEVNETELRVACVEQRIRTCQECIDREGRSQQSLVMTTPKYYKRYILPGKPVEEMLHGSKHDVPKYNGFCLDNEDNHNHLIRENAQAMLRGTQPTSRRGRSVSPPPQPSVQPGSFSFKEKTNTPKISEKRSVSPFRSIFPLIRSGSLSSRPTTPHSSRPTTPIRSRPTTPTPSRQRTPSRSRSTTPNPSYTRLQHQSDFRKSSSNSLHAERNTQKDSEQYPSKSKRLFKALLGRRKSKQDEMLYTFLDEY